jgi:D-beta-D-heptose 7-phosphate kinase/D-beta-D-heptose 1-phosphate adenosyltransferase
MNTRAKIKSLSALLAAVRRDKARGRRIVFTNGCFDLLHSGHVALLERARRLGDRLIVAMNSDRSVRRLKGPGRPVVDQRDRARVLAGLTAVDYVTIFHDATPRRVLARIRPHVLVKGADWGRDQIVGGDLVEGSGGRVVRVPLVRGQSTAGLLRRIRRGRAP